jgi:predicted DNA-binding protein
MTNKKSVKPRNVVSTVVTDEARAKLESLSRSLDRTKSWILSRLILAASVDELQDIPSNDD